MHISRWAATRTVTAIAVTVAVALAWVTPDLRADAIPTPTPLASQPTSATTALGGTAVPAQPTAPSTQATTPAVVIVGATPSAIASTVPTPARDIPTTTVATAAPTSSTARPLVSPTETLTVATATATLNPGPQAPKPARTAAPVRKRETVADGITQVAGGNTHTCAVTVVGIAHCWGLNGSGQLGTNGTNSSAVPLVAPTTNEWGSVAAGAGHTCATATDGLIKCWGDNTAGQLGGAQSPASPAVNGVSWANVSVGASHSCALATTGAAYCWGRSDYGQVGDGGAAGVTVRSTPVAVAGGQFWSSLSARGNATCAISKTSQAYCWGHRFPPRAGSGADWLITPTLAGGGLPWREISVGGEHACGITTSDELYCWGQNVSGQLGDGTAVERSGPVALGGAASSMAWRSVAAGQSHTCAIDTAGKAWCWGSNLSGQLGDGSPADTIRKLPGAVASSLTWSSIAAGQSHACAVSDAGVAWCWGANESGQGGDGTTVIIRSTPRRVYDQVTTDQPGVATPVATATPAARHLRVANVRDTAFTVAWVTDSPSTGVVRWWPDGNPSAQVAYDTRGSGTVDTVHYVNVTGLTAGSRYVFDLVSGAATDPNAGGHFAVTTGPTLGTSSPDTATGTVEDVDGSRASAAIVIIGVGPTSTVSASAPMAALVTASSNGTWNTNLSSLRTADRTAPFVYTDTTVAHLEVIGGPTAFVNATATVANLRLASRAAQRLVATPFSATMTVATGWNLVALAVDPADPMTASTVCSRLDSAGGAATTTEVVRWEVGAWESHRCGIAANDFLIDPDRGYFIRATKSASITLTGTPADPKQGRILEGGWNLVGLGTAAAMMDAPTLLASFDGASGVAGTGAEAARWQAGAWESFQRTLNVNRFTIEGGRGYFVRLSRPVAWTHVGGNPATGR
jgi:alpha-tubulin suppressor-like RCC1 family protein